MSLSRGILGDLLYHLKKTFMRYELHQRKDSHQGRNISINLSRTLIEKKKKINGKARPGSFVSTKVSMKQMQETVYKKKLKGKSEDNGNGSP
ncbi:unnamed protein product [Arabis nemorensis]|uniref:Uncharacterized protein n=1 Tax=Arabis nemorensis TaxID=586526 RepID=A0A565BKQ4_9BRAS|nr:unnamed protein product [Arabis nemorensis]